MVIVLGMVIESQGQGHRVWGGDQYDCVRGFQCVCVRADQNRVLEELKFEPVDRSRSEVETWEKLLENVLKSVKK